MRGIVLAAGEASRLPNKALLPISKTQIAVESALRFCQEKCGDVTLVDSPAGLIKRVLAARGNSWNETVYQPRPVGVVDAISRAVNSDGEYLVTFCDCVYTEALEDRILVGASVRKSKNKELDWWNISKREWQSRMPGDYCDKRRFIGWLSFTQQQFLDALRYVDEDCSLIGLMSQMNLRPVYCEKPVWDIGTVDSYLDYITEGPVW